MTWCWTTVLLHAIILEFVTDVEHASALTLHEAGASSVNLSLVFLTIRNPWSLWSTVSSMRWDTGQESFASMIAKRDSYQSESLCGIIPVQWPWWRDALSWLGKWFPQIRITCRQLPRSTLKIVQKPWIPMQKFSVSATCLIVKYKCVWRREPSMKLERFPF